MPSSSFLSQNLRSVSFSSERSSAFENVRHKRRRERFVRPMMSSSISDAETKGSRASEGWIDGADVLDLVAQFENSWESVGALLPRLMRHQTMGEDPAEDEAQGLWQQLKEAALLISEVRARRGTPWDPPCPS